MIPRMYTHVIGSNTDMAIAKQDFNDGFEVFCPSETVFRNIAFFY